MDRTQLIFEIRDLLCSYGGITIKASDDVERLISDIANFIEEKARATASNSQSAQSSCSGCGCSDEPVYCPTCQAKALSR